MLALSLVLAPCLGYAFEEAASFAEVESLHDAFDEAGYPAEKEGYGHPESAEEDLENNPMEAETEVRV